MKLSHTKWIAGILAGVALSSSFQTAIAARAKAEPMPDLTSGGKPDDSSAVPLGPTGMRGWIYHQHLDTSEARQVLVTVIDKGSPSDGKMSCGDVILGASGSGKDPGPFESDARLQLADAINQAEARTPAELRLLVWRKGKQQVIPLTLRTMGAYSPTAPFDCPKSAKILDEALDHLAGQKDFGKFEWSMIGLLAGHDPANPKSEQRMQAVRKRLPEMLLSREEIESILSGEVETQSKAPWRRGHTLIALAEYYLQTKDQSVLPSIEACAVSIANGQSIYGTMGHLYQRRADDGSRGSITGYGPVNSSALPALLGLVIARECGIDRPELEPAIQRGSNFFAYYAGKGAIPYGENQPITKSHENNGKSGLAALVMRHVPGRAKESVFFAKMAAASFPEREGGHTGPYFNYQWAPLGAYAGSKDALVMHFKHIRWHLDLCRQWNGGFAFSKILGKKDVLDYSGLDPIAPPLLVYAAPLRSLVITGKGLKDEILTKEDVDQAEFAALYDATKRSDEELFEDFACWSPKVKQFASKEIATRGMEPASLLAKLMPIAQKADHPGRVAALMALGNINDPRAARLLATCLTDPDPLVRAVSAGAMRSLPHEILMPELETMLKACASTAKPAIPLDPEDPVQFAHGNLCMLLFYGGSAYGPKGILTSKEIVDQVDRKLLYPAIRAAANNPSGQNRSTVKSVYPYLTEEDLDVLADTVVNAVVERAPADSMFSASIRRAGIQLLREHGYIEAEKAAAIVIDDTNDNRKAKAIDELKAPKGHMPTKTFKSIDSVSADAAGAKLPARSALLKVVAHDKAMRSHLYTWRKVEGPGELEFKPNAASDADTCQITASVAGNYVVEVIVSDSQGLSEVSESITVPLK